MVGSSSLRSRGLRQPVGRARGCCPAPARSSLPFTFDFFFPAWLRPRLLPYFGLFRLLCFLAVAFLARNPSRRRKDSGLTLDVGFSPAPESSTYYTRSDTGPGKAGARVRHVHVSRAAVISAGPREEECGPASTRWGARGAQGAGAVP